MNWFYLSEEGFSLHCSSVGLVRHVHLGEGGSVSAEDLSQSSESLWRHKLLFKSLRMGRPSGFLFPQRSGGKILL